METVGREKNARKALKGRCIIAQAKGLCDKITSFEALKGRSKERARALALIKAQCGYCLWPTPLQRAFSF